MNVRLRPGMYYLAFSNKFSAFTAKQVFPHRPELQDNRNLLLTPGNWGVWRTASSRGGGKLMSGCARVACASCARAMKQLCPVALDHAELPCRPYYQCPRWTSSR